MLKLGYFNQIYSNGNRLNTVLCEIISHIISINYGIKQKPIYAFKITLNNSQTSNFQNF